MQSTASTDETEQRVRNPIRSSASEEDRENQHPSYGSVTVGRSMSKEAQEDGPLALDTWLRTDAKYSFWLTRLVLLRCMGAVYLAAFLTSGFESRQLLGPKGLQPGVVGPSFTGGPYLFDPWKEDRSHAPGVGERPTPIFALLGLTEMSIAIVSWSGCFLSLLLVTGLCTGILVPALLWLMWLSVLNLGSRYISDYGWEWQTCEVGILICFLCHFPLKGSFWRDEFPVECPTPYLVLLLLRWMSFRVMIGAGLSKIDPRHWRANASTCWQDLTCTTTHYETTGAPNPLGYWMHKQPLIVHKGEVALNHFVELFVPWLFLVPIRQVRIPAACISLFFMVCISITGNYSYINHITAVPMIACLDDAFLAWMFPTTAVNAARISDVKSGSAENRFWGCLFSGRWPFESSILDQVSWRSQGDKVLHVGRGAVDWLLRNAAYFALVFMILSKSRAPLQKTFGPRPWLNYYDDYFFVNAYGVFGFVNEIRLEMVLSYLPHGASQTNTSAAWQPLDFHCKPSSINLMPCIINPYHDRFDWVTWIDTTASLEQSYMPGTVPSQFVPYEVDVAVAKLLHGDTDAASLFGTPLTQLFRNGHPPTKVRAELYLYKFSDVTSLLSRGEWWQRTPIATAAQGREKAVGVSEVPSDEISQKSPNHDSVLLICTLGALIAVVGLHDENARDFSWRPTAVMLGGFMLVSGLFRTITNRAFLANWMSLFVIMVGHVVSGNSRLDACNRLQLMSTQVLPVLPAVAKQDYQYQLTQLRRFRLLNGILLTAFISAFFLSISGAADSGAAYWAVVVIAMLGIGAGALGISHAKDYVDGACVGGMVALAALILEAGQAANFRPPLPP